MSGNSRLILRKDNRMMVRPKFLIISLASGANDLIRLLIVFLQE